LVDIISKDYKQAYMK